MPINPSKIRLKELNSLSPEQLKNLVLLQADALKKLKKQLLHQTTHDPLTSLPNRALLLDRLDQAILNVNRTKSIVGVLSINLDEFKFIVNSYGYHKSDELLTIIAERLAHHIRKVDTVARISGDEFVVVLQFLNKVEDAIASAQKIMHIISQPIIIEQKEWDITASIGISIYPQDGKSSTELIKNADIAMNHAKKLGRNNFQFYTKELNQKLQQHIALEKGLRAAIENNQFKLDYQPCIDIHTGEIIAVEALARWNSPELGIISPKKFIHAAEENDLIIPIGEILLRKACLQQKTWLDHGLSLNVAVNISGKQLKHTKFLDMVKRIIKETQINSEHLQFELTETVLLDDLEKSVTTLKKIRNLGIKILIDDFGTGYSSLSYLKKLPINKLKIDISFIKGLPNDKASKAIILAIITLAKNLNLKVLAEGVENSKQLNFLRRHGCDEAQGFYIAKPMGNDALITFINNALDKK